MNIIKVSPRGYCKGVVRAISIAKQCRERYPDQPITVLGMLVHNERRSRNRKHECIHRRTRRHHR